MVIIGTLAMVAMNRSIHLLDVKLYHLDFRQVVQQGLQADLEKWSMGHLDQSEQIAARTFERRILMPTAITSSYSSE